MYEHVNNNDNANIEKKNEYKTGKDFNNKNKEEYFRRYDIKVRCRGRMY